MGAPGYQIISADGVLNTSGAAVRVFGINIDSGGGGAGVVILRNGTSGSATAVVTESGTTGAGRHIDFGDAGFYFPAGCYVDIDANVDQVTVIFRREP